MPDYTAPLRPVLSSPSSTSSASYKTALEGTAAAASLGVGLSATASSTASVSSMYYSAESADGDDEGDSNGSSNDDDDDDSDEVDPETVRNAAGRGGGETTPTGGGMARFKQDLLAELSQQGSTEEVSTNSPDDPTATDDTKEDVSEERLRKNGSEGDDLFADSFPGNEDIETKSFVGEVYGYLFQTPPCAETASTRWRR